MSLMIKYFPFIITDVLVDSIPKFGITGHEDLDYDSKIPGYEIYCFDKDDINTFHNIPDAQFKNGNRQLKLRYPEADERYYERNLIGENKKIGDIGMLEEKVEGNTFSIKIVHSYQIHKEHFNFFSKFFQYGYYPRHSIASDILELVNKRNDEVIQENRDNNLKILGI